MMSCVYNWALSVTGQERKEEAKKDSNAGVGRSVYTYTPRDVILYALGGRCGLGIHTCHFALLVPSWSLPLADGCI